MKEKVIGLLLSALLIPGIARAQQNYRIEPSPWAYSWGVGMGTMIPQGGLAAHFKPGFALDTEVGGFYGNLFLMANGGFSANKLAKEISVGDNSRWPSGSGSIHAFIGVNLGVNFDVDQLSIYPFGGLAYSFLEPNLKAVNSDPALDGFKVDGVGINLGIGVDHNIPDGNFEAGDINRILKIGLRYQCQIPNYKKSIPLLNGTTHWITLRFMIGSSFPGRAVYNQ